MGTFVEVGLLNLCRVYVLSLVGGAGLGHNVILTPMHEFVSVATLRFQKLRYARCVFASCQDPNPKPLYWPQQKQSCQGILGLR